MQTTNENLKEVLAYGRLFAPQAVPADVQVRCAECDLIDETRRGHNLNDCLRALKDAVTLFKAQGMVIPQQRSWL